MGFEDRVKYLPINDLFCGNNIDKVEKLFEYQKTIPSDINEALEFYNIFLYFNNTKLRWRKWDSDQVKKYRSFSEQLKSNAYKYIASISDTNFISIMNEIEFGYIDDLITILEQSTKFKNISKYSVELYLKENKSFIYHAIKNYFFVNHYGEVIKRFLISNTSAEILISAEDSKNNDAVDRKYIPKCLTEDDRNEIFERYINSSEPNPNYLHLLISIPFEKAVPVTILNAAKDKKKAIEKQLFSGAGRSFSFSIRFVKDQKEKVLSKNNSNLSLDMYYSLDWIENNLSFDYLMCNFIDMFGFVDNQYRITTMRKSTGSSLIDYLSMLKNNKVYQKSYFFDFYESMLNCELQAYREVLLKNNIYIESLLNTFYSNYLSSEFHFPIIKTHLTSDKKSYLEKCHEIVTNIDIICKQFFHFAIYKKIDKELLLLDTERIRIENIPSLVKNKYAFGNGVNYQGMIYALFSDQCLLNYVQSKNLQYDCFFDLLEKQTIYKSDYPEYQYQTLEELEKWDLLSIAEDGKLSINNINRVLILRDLYTYEFINFNRFDNEMQNEILEMNKLGLIEFEDTLLSNHESAYFNYYLNDKYPNGPKLRNKYAHGLEYLENDESIHFNNYIVLLRLLILLSLKINDDICLFSQNGEVA